MVLPFPAQPTHIHATSVKQATGTILPPWYELQRVTPLENRLCICMCFCAPAALFDGRRQLRSTASARKPLGTRRPVCQGQFVCFTPNARSARGSSVRGLFDGPTSILEKLTRQKENTRAFSGSVRTPEPLNSCPNVLLK